MGPQLRRVQWAHSREGCSGPTAEKGAVGKSRVCDTVGIGGRSVGTQSKFGSKETQYPKIPKMYKHTHTHTHMRALLLPVSHISA